MGNDASVLETQQSQGLDSGLGERVGWTPIFAVNFVKAPLDGVELANHIKLLFNEFLSRLPPGANYTVASPVAFPVAKDEPNLVWYLSVGGCYYAQPKVESTTKEHDPISGIDLDQYPEAVQEAILKAAAQGHEIQYGKVDQRSGVPDLRSVIGNAERPRRKQAKAKVDKKIPEDSQELLSCSVRREREVKDVKADHLIRCSTDGMPDIRDL